MTALVLCLLFAVSGDGAAPAGACPAFPSAVLPDDLQELQDVVVRIRLREPEEEPGCVPGEVCVSSCEEGTACAACDRLLVDALLLLTSNESDDAARSAAALVLDRRLGWDGGHALTLSYAVTRMKARVLPYLRPHVAESTLAKRIVECIDLGHPCI